MTHILADELLVEIIQTLLAYVAYIMFLGTSMFFVFKLIRDRRKMVGLKHINAGQAKLAMLRISFKAKIKKKAQQFRATFRKTLPKGEVADLALEEMVDLKFETGEDFQRYFDICKKVNVFIKADAAGPEGAAAASATSPEGAPPSSGQVFEDFMSTDFKNELAIIRLIREMVEVSSDINRKIDSYNNMHTTKPLPKADPLSFVSMIDVNRVFDDEEHQPNETPTDAASGLSKVA